MSLYSPARWHRNYDITVVSRSEKKKKIINDIVEAEASVSRLVFAGRTDGIEGKINRRDFNTK